MPLKLIKLLAAQEELPTTTKRPCEFPFPLLYVPAAAMVSGPFLFLGSLTLTLAELRLLVARLLLEESKSFSNAPGFLRALDLHGAGQRKARRRSLHLVHDGLGAVTGNQRHLRPKTGQLANWIEIQNQILAQRHTPARELIRERVIVGDFRIEAQA